MRLYRFLLLGTICGLSLSWGTNTLVNGSFEQPVIGTTPPDPVKSWAGGKIVTYKDSDVNGWNTTASDHEIEFWSDAAGNPFEGKQFIELNANEVAAVYQDVPTIPGKKFNWFVAHRGRSGVDTARVLIGSPNGSLVEVKTMIDDKDSWGTYIGSYEVPQGQSVTRLQFEAVSTASGNDTIGNFLDGFKVGPVIQYKMDECYWLGSGHEDVFDSSLNGSNGEALNGAKIGTTDAIINHAGIFDGSDDYISVADASALDFNQTFTMTLWVKPQDDNTAVLLDRSTSSSSGWSSSLNSGFRVSYKSSGIFGGTKKVTLEVFVDGSLETVSLEPSSWYDNNWHFIAIRYDGESLYMRVDDDNTSTDNVTGSIDNATNQSLSIAASNDSKDYYNGFMDEVKIFAVALGDDEIDTLKENDLSGKNYTGVKRDSIVCSSNISAHSWDLIGVPADFRNPDNDKKTVLDIFGDDMSGSYGDDWRVYRRVYSDTNNSSGYEFMDSDDVLTFGMGYWLGSKLDSTWSENGALGVDYNSSTNGTNDCPAERCVEIDIKSVSLDVTSGDALFGTGPYRYFMTGFVGRSPVDWADCRFIVTDSDGSNREVLTPSDAESVGYINKQIWQYNPDDSNANSNGYTTCDDVTPGSCKLVPYKGFWIEMQGPTKNKIVKLLIPKE